MQFTDINKLLVHIQAVSIDDHEDFKGPILFTESKLRSPLMVGTIKTLTQHPEGNKTGLRVGDRVLVESFTLRPDGGHAILAYPVGKQAVTEDGEYMVYEHAILAILEPVSQD